MKHAKMLLWLRILVSAAVLVLAALQLLQVWDRAIHAAVPLLGVTMVLQAATEWHTHRAAAVLGLCAAGFLFACTVAVFFF